MKKGIAIIVIVALVVGIGIAYLITLKPHILSSTNNTALASSSVTACDVLSETVAKQLLGSDATQPSGSDGDTSTSDITVSNCMYTVTSAGGAKASGVTVLARVAKTSDGVSTNKAQFADMPSGVQVVSGIGDKAYYSPTFHQLNVLKGSNWYIISYYTDSPANATLKTDTQLAKKLNFQ